MAVAPRAPGDHAPAARGRAPSSAWSQAAAPLSGARVLHVSPAAGAPACRPCSPRCCLWRPSLGLRVEWRVLFGGDDLREASAALHDGLQGAESALELPDPWTAYLAACEHAAARDRRRLRRASCCTTPARWDWRPRSRTRWSGAATSTPRRPTPRPSSARPSWPSAARPSCSATARSRPSSCRATASTRRRRASIRSRPLNLELQPRLAGRLLRPLGIDLSRPLCAQVMRLDRWKDPHATIEAFELAKAELPDLQLVLAGALDGAAEDGWRAAKEISDYAAGTADVHLLTSYEGVGELELGALQRLSRVALQRSLREGFGLGASEALWKGDAGGRRPRRRDPAAGAPRRGRLSRRRRAGHGRARWSSSCATRAGGRDGRARGASACASASSSRARCEDELRRARRYLGAPREGHPPRRHPARAARRRHRRRRRPRDRRGPGARGARRAPGRRPARPGAPLRDGGRSRSSPRKGRRRALAGPPRRRARAGHRGPGALPGREDLDRPADRGRLLLRLRVPRGREGLRGGLRAHRGEDARAHQGRRAVRARRTCPSAEAHRALPRRGPGLQGRADRGPVRDEGVETVSLYRNGPFTDLCRGPHAPEHQAHQGVQAHLGGRRLLARRRRAARCSPASTAPRSSRRRTSRSTCAASRRPARATTASSGSELGLFMFSELSPGSPFWLPNGHARLERADRAVARPERRARLHRGAHADPLRRRPLEAVRPLARLPRATCTSRTWRAGRWASSP